MYAQIIHHMLKYLLPCANQMLNVCECAFALPTWYLVTTASPLLERNTVPVQRKFVKSAIKNNNKFMYSWRYGRTKFWVPLCNNILEIGQHPRHNTWAHIPIKMCAFQFRRTRHIDPGPAFLQREVRFLSFARPLCQVEAAAEEVGLFAPCRCASGDIFP